MKRSTAAKAPRRIDLTQPDGAAWRERSGRLFAELERPAMAMVRRAFRGAFSVEEIEDIYSTAWTATLRALAGRHGSLSDDQIRSYVFAAVANQAGKEIRRRRRKPTAPLELVGGIADNSAEGPDERAAEAEQSRLTRDLLASLPARRRAVMLLRYGWGLEPSQVCALVKGLSPRAYRKEITRGVQEMTERMRAVESGEWCISREPLLRAFAAGLADADQERQARAHLAHCRECSSFVARLVDRLHDLGGAVLVPGVLHGIDGQISLGDRLLELVDRARDVTTGLVSRGPNGADELASQAAASGGLRGAGAAGAGLTAKIAGLGSAGKLAAACVGGGVAATACVAAGIGPLGLGGDAAPKTVAERPAPKADRDAKASVAPRPDLLPSRVGHEPRPVPETTATPVEPSSGNGEEATSSPSTPEPTETAAPVAVNAPPVEREFGAPAAAAPATPAPAPAAPAAGDSEGASSGSVVRQEFAP